MERGISCSLIPAFSDTEGTSHPADRDLLVIQRIESATRYLSNATPPTPHDAADLMARSYESMRQEMSRVALKYTRRIFEPFGASRLVGQGSAFRVPLPVTSHRIPIFSSRQRHERHH
jgi:hypothetical protein